MYLLRRGSCSHNLNDVLGRRSVIRLSATSPPLSTPARRARNGRLHLPSGGQCLCPGVPVRADTPGVGVRQGRNNEQPLLSSSRPAQKSLRGTACTVCKTTRALEQSSTRPQARTSRRRRERAGLSRVQGVEILEKSVPRKDFFKILPRPLTGRAGTGG